VAIPFDEQCGQAAQDHIARAAAEFPATFGLRAFPGDTFRVSIGSSYINGSGLIMLYTEIMGHDGSWRVFAKGTPEELKAQLRG